MNRISDELYKQILENMPIVCADGLLHYGNKIILFKRAYEPAKDEWWVFGGRLLKGEKLKDCIIRKAKDEMGIDVKIEKRIGVYETEFDKNRQGVSTHSVNVVFLVTSDEKPDFSQANYKEFTEVKEFEELDERWNWYIKDIIKDSKVLE
jgi:colanic acid biosynthesis protein WcaH